MIKRIIPVTLAIMLLLTALSYARVEKITINGEVVTSDVAPMLMNGWFMVPLGAISRKVGADVFWDSDNRLVKLHYLDNKIIVRIGDTNAVVNGQLMPMDIPATIVRGRTMVTSRFMADCIDAAVDWDYHSTSIMFEQNP